MARRAPHGRDGTDRTCDPQRFAELLGQPHGQLQRSVETLLGQIRFVPREKYSKHYRASPKTVDSFQCLSLRLRQELVNHVIRFS